MFLAWSPMRSIAFATHTISSDGGNGARILHHEGDQLAQHGAELVVDRRVLAQHLGGRWRRRGARTHRAPGAACSTAISPTWRIAGKRCALACAPRSWICLRHARDLLGLVADALEVGHDLGDRHDQAQVARRRLALTMRWLQSLSIATS